MCSHDFRCCKRRQSDEQPEKTVIINLSNPVHTVATGKPEPPPIPPDPKANRHLEAPGNDPNNSPSAGGEYMEVTAGRRLDPNGGDYETVPAISGVNPDAMTAGNSSASPHYERLVLSPTSSVNVRNEYEQLAFEV